MTVYPPVDWVAFFPNMPADDPIFQALGLDTEDAQSFLDALVAQGILADFYNPTDNCEIHFTSTTEDTHLVITYMKQSALTAEDFDTAEGFVSKIVFDSAPAFTDEPKITAEPETTAAPEATAEPETSSVDFFYILGIILGIVVIVAVIAFILFKVLKK